MTSRYRLVVKRPIELLSSVIDILCGNAHLALEGDLSHLDIDRFENVSTEPTDVLTRATIMPQQDFVILLLEPHTKDPIIRSLPRIGLRDRVIHVQLEKDGILQFAAYDNFRPDSVWVTNRIDTAVVQSWVNDSIIQSYAPVE